MWTFRDFLIELTGINPDKNLARILADVERAGNWELQKNKDLEQWGHVYATLFNVVPRSFPSSVKPLGSGKGWYDTAMAHLAPASETDIRIGIDYAILSSYEWQQEIPASRQPGIFYRGMSAAEYLHIQSTGIVASPGDYNLGAQEVGLTFYSADPEQAVSYACGFAPWQFVPSFGRSAYVIAIKDPGRKTLVRGDERGVPGEIKTSDITAVYEGRPYMIKFGSLEAYKDYSDFHSEGSRSGATVRVAWKKIK